MTKLFFVPILWVACACAVAAQDYRTRFEQLMDSGSATQQLNLIREWQTHEPNNAEVYVAFFNCYYKQSLQEVVRVGTEPGNGDNLQITDSAAHTVGYMYDDVMYNDSLFNLAMHYIDTGIAKHPRRLDMYFGKIYALGERKDFEREKTEILNTIARQATHTEWLWKDDKPLPDADAKFKSSVQDYMSKMFDNDPPVLDAIEEISSRMMKLFPKDIENYSNVGACYATRGDYPKALTWFMKAEAINANDPIVLNNIGDVYAHMNQPAKAVTYFERMAKVGSADDAAYANKRIEALRRP